MPKQSAQAGRRSSSSTPGFELKPDLEVGITVGAGHLHRVEATEQLIAMIQRFLAVSL